MIIHISHILYYIYDIFAINSSYVHIYIYVYTCVLPYTLHILYTVLVRAIHLDVLLW